MFITYTMSSFPKAASDMRLVNAAAPWFRALAAGPLGMAGRRRRGGEESRQTEAASARESNERRAKERALAFGRSALQSRSGAPRAFPITQARACLCSQLWSMSAEDFREGYKEEYE